MCQTTLNGSIFYLMLKSKNGLFGQILMHTNNVGTFLSHPQSDDVTEFRKTKTRIFFILHRLRSSDQKDFQYTAVKLEADKVIRIEELYRLATEFIPSLKLSKNAVLYYAYITQQYAASRLRQSSKHQ